MNRLTIFILVTFVALSSVCGACAISCEDLYSTVQDQSLVAEEWTIEFNNTESDRPSLSGNLKPIEITNYTEPSSVITK